MQSRQKSLRRTADLADAGLIPRAALPELARVAARYAVAITPAVAELIHPDDTGDPIPKGRLEAIPEAIYTVEEQERRERERRPPI